MEEVKVNCLSFKLSDRYGDSQVFKGKYKKASGSVVDVAIKRLVKDEIDDQVNPRNKASYVLQRWEDNDDENAKNIMRILHHEKDDKYMCVPTPYLII
jgi:ATP-dependent Clp protease adapter protein ClpS